MRRMAIAISVVACCSLTGACGSDDSTAEDGSSAGSCTDPASASCDFQPCGGDIVGTWKLIEFCAPSCVSSVYQVVSFGEDGSYNGGQGSWEPTGAEGFSITVGNGTASYSYCVSGGILWTQHGTNCGTESGPVTILRERDDCGGDGEDPRR